ncbi:MAG: hypothetical protein LBD37_02885 [Treponema sp.]|nr:hypothetical protein [Treponema sp.]
METGAGRTGSGLSGITVPAAYQRRGKPAAGYGRHLNFVKPSVDHISLFQPNSVVILSIGIPATAAPMTPAIRNIPTGAKDTPVGVKDTPAEANDIPAGIKDIPAEAKDIPRAVCNQRLNARGIRISGEDNFFEKEHKYEPSYYCENGNGGIGAVIHHDAGPGRLPRPYRP